MTFNEFKKIRQELMTDVDKLFLVLKAFPKLGNGLTPDEVKFSKEFKEAKAAFDDAFRELRAFNDVYVKQFKRELAEERIEIRRNLATKGQKS